MVLAGIKVLRRQGKSVVTTIFVLTVLVAKAFCRAPVSSEAAALFWRLNKLVAQGRHDAARQLAQDNAKTAMKVWADLLFDQLEDALDEEAAPLSPHAEEVQRLLSDLFPDACPAELADWVRTKAFERRPPPPAPTPVTEAVQRFITAYRSPSNEQIARWREAIQKCAALGTELGLAFSLHRLAWAERTEGSLSLAHAYASQAATLLDRWQHSAKLPRFLNTLGILALQLGDYREVEKLLLDGLKQAEAIGSRRWQIACLNNLSILYTRTRNYEEALRRAMRATELVSERDSPRLRVGVWANLGNIYRRLGNFEQALHYLKEAAALAQSSGDRALQAEVLHLLGMAMRDKGDTEGALKTLQQALQIWQQLGSTLRQIEVLNDLGDTLAKTERFQEARNYFEQAFQIAEATKHLPSRALALLNLGAIYDELGDHERSLAFSRQALSLWQSIDDPWFIALCWANIGEAYRHLGDKVKGDRRERLWGQALDAYWQSVRLIERLQRRAGPSVLRAEFLQTAIEPFHRLVDLLAQMGRVEEALEVAERARAQALLSALQSAPPPTETLLTDAERKVYRQLQQQIAALEGQIVAEAGRGEQDERRLQDLRQALEAARAEMGRLQDAARLRQVGLPMGQETREPVLPTLLRRLPSDLAILSYVVTKRRTWLFVIARSGQRWQVTAHSIPVTATTLTEDVLWLRESILKRRSIAITARRLYELLIAPAEARLWGKRRMCIVPDGLLYSLPFQALIDRSDNYLLERWVIAYAPSLRWLALQPPTSSVRPQLRWTGLGIAHWRPPLPSLPFVRQELSEIGKLLGKERGSTIRTFLDAQATKAKAKEALRTSRWVHFATHALLEPERAFYSRLLLAPDGDDALRAYEVLEMGRLTAELVVLSACDTGQGRIVRGEGLLGLAWAFWAGGVRTLVASQWRVNDASAAFLMRHFYRYLLKGLPPSDALRNAQLATLRHPLYAHPFFWAPFALWARNL